MDRRTLVILVAGTCLLEPLAVRAQQTGKVFRIGLLAPYTEPTPWGRIDLEELRIGLRDPAELWRCGTHVCPLEDG